MAQFNERKLLTPKYGNLTYFPFDSFKFTALFVSQGLDELITYYGTYFPDLIRVLYNNLS